MAGVGRQVITAVVSSAKMNQAVTVTRPKLIWNKKIHKHFKATKKLRASDPSKIARAGDVIVVERQNEARTTNKAGWVVREIRPANHVNLFMRPRFIDLEAPAAKKVILTAHQALSKLVEVHRRQERRYLRRQSSAQKKLDADGKADKARPLSDSDGVTQATDNNAPKSPQVEINFSVPDIRSLVPEKQWEAIHQMKEMAGHAAYRAHQDDLSRCKSLLKRIGTSPIEKWRSQAEPVYLHFWWRWRLGRALAEMEKLMRTMHSLGRQLAEVSLKSTALDNVSKAGFKNTVSQSVLLDAEGIRQSDMRRAREEGQRERERIAAAA